MRWGGFIFWMLYLLVSPKQRSHGLHNRMYAFVIKSVAFSEVLYDSMRCQIRIFAILVYFVLHGFNGFLVKQAEQSCLHYVAVIWIGGKKEIKREIKGKKSC